MDTAATRHLVFFSDCPYYGGAEAYLVLLAQARPHPAWRLSALVPAGEPGEVLAANLANFDVNVVRYAQPPIPSRRQLRDPRSLPRRIPRGVAQWRELDRALRALRGDVLHLNLPSVYDARHSVPALLAKCAGYRRVVTTEHLPMVLRARRRMIVKSLLAPSIDAIIVHTTWNRDRLAKYHHMPRGKMHVIPNGSPEAPAMTSQQREALRVRLGLPVGAVALAVVARLTERKGHRYLFEALSRVAPGSGAAASGGPDWRLLIVGEGEAEQALRAQAARLGLDGRVSFLGYRSDAREIIHACDILVLPSLLETQPLVLTEAMASARPIVATAIYGIPEIVADGETGLLVPPADAAALAQALARLIAEGEQRAALGNAARRRYEAHFTLELMGERTYRVLSG
jgi:glycosyltransferase involved in cell wall biosynthesis